MLELNLGQSSTDKNVFQKGNVTDLKFSKSSKTDKEKQKKEQQQEAHQRQKADKQVGKYSENIASNTDGLRIVWNLVRLTPLLAVSCITGLVFTDLRRSVPHRDTFKGHRVRERSGRKSSSLSFRAQSSPNDYRFSYFSKGSQNYRSSITP